jgi:hypothetical protein
MEPVTAAFGTDIIRVLEEATLVEADHFCRREGAEFDEGTTEVEHHGCFFGGLGMGDGNTHNLLIAKQLSCHVFTWKATIQVAAFQAIVALGILGFEFIVII